MGLWATVPRDALTNGIHSNPMWLPGAICAVAWWVLGFAAPRVARLPTRVALWSTFASCYVVADSWLLVPVVGALLDLACRLLWCTLPELAVSEAVAHAPGKTHRRKTAPRPRQKTA